MAKKSKSEPKTSIPVNDAWTGMLAVSLLALLAALAFLFFDWQQYLATGPKADFKNLMQISDEPGQKEPPAGDDGAKGGDDKKGPADDKKGAVDGKKADAGDGKGDAGKKMP